MARFGAINDVGDSVVKLLENRRKLRASADGLPDPLNVSHLSIGQLNNETNPPKNRLTLLCYRALPSSQQRPRAAGASSQRMTHLGVELHYLLTAWAESALIEQLMLAWAMLELHRHPILDRSVLLGGDKIWDRDEAVHFVPEPIAHDAMFRLWDALQPKYRLSAAYCARVVHISDAAESDGAAPVVTKSLGFANAGLSLELAS